MKKLLIVVLITVFTAPPFVYCQENSETKLLKQFHTIQSEEMMSWMQKLCSQEFKGRLTGSPEFVLSAEWVAAKLKEWGIKPAGDNGDEEG